MDEIRYGIIGTGMMGIEHIANIIALPDAVVTAVADPNPRSLADGVKAAGGGETSHRVATFSDYREMLAAGLCDALVVATPNVSHVDVLCDILGTPHHILVEKPLCTTIADCRKVIEAAARHDAIMWVGLEYRYMPPIARLIDEVAAGTVGRLHMLAIREHRFPFLVKVDNWNRFNVNTGGTLVEKCCHFFDLMNHITGTRPLRVIASGAQSVNHLKEIYDGIPSDILDNAYVIVDYPDDVRAMLDLCMFAEATHNQEELIAVGDAGKIEALIPENIVRIGRRGEHWIGGVETYPVSDDRVAYEGHHHGSSYIEHLEFCAAIRSGKNPAVGLEDGLWSTAVGVAAHRSIEERRPVDLDEVLA